MQNDLILESKFHVNHRMIKNNKDKFKLTRCDKIKLGHLN